MSFESIYMYVYIYRERGINLFKEVINTIKRDAN